MIESLWITNPNNETLELNLRSSEATHGLLVFNLEGLGSPKATVTGSTGFNYDGVRNYFVSADARHLILTLAVSDRGSDEETAREKIYQYFPVKAEITFRVTTEDGKDVSTQAFVESVEMNQFAKVENAVISLYCADPYFFETDFSSATMLLDTPTNILYSGSIPTGILINCDIGGQCTDITITNDNGSQSMQIELPDEANGSSGLRSQLIVDTRFGSKEVLWISREGSIYDITGSGVSLSQDWIELRRGNNTITVSATINAPDAPGGTNLKGYWPLDGRGVNVAYDRHTGEHHIPQSGTKALDDGVGMPNYPLYETAIDFISGNSLYFRTTNVEPDFQHLGGGESSFSVCFWASPGDVMSGGVEYTIASMWDDIGNSPNWYGGWQIFFIGNTSMAFRTSVSAGSSTLLGSRATGWNFYACRYDHVSGTKYISMNAGTPDTGGPINIGASNSRLCIGARSDDLSDPMNGQIQGLAYFNDFLTQDEVAFIYNSGTWVGRRYVELTGDIETTIQYQIKHIGV